MLRKRKANPDIEELACWWQRGPGVLGASLELTARSVELNFIEMPVVGEVTLSWNKIKA